MTNRHTYTELLYRLNVGITVFNNRGDVLVCKRPGYEGKVLEYGWQMPQGGIDDNEDVVEAGYRELYEETNIPKEAVTLIKRTKHPLRYNYPPDHVKPDHPVKYHHGQEQYWIALRLIEDDSVIDLENCPDPSFVDWKWVALEAVPELIIPFKREVYKQVVNKFRNIRDTIRSD